MTTDELIATIRRLGLTKAAVARLCGVERGAVSHWTSGRTDVPAYAGVILHHYEQLLALPALRAIERRYRWLVDRERPRFSTGEALAICDALNGVAFPDPEAIPLLWANVADAEGLGEKWSVDHAALADGLRGLRPAEAVAVAESVEQFWRAVAAGASTDDALALSDLTTDLTGEQAIAALSFAIHHGATRLPPGWDEASVRRVLDADDPDEAELRMAELHRDTLARLEARRRARRPEDRS